MKIKMAIFAVAAAILVPTIIIMSADLEGGLKFIFLGAFVGAIVFKFLHRNEKSKIEESKSKPPVKKVRPK